MKQVTADFAEQQLTRLARHLQETGLGRGETLRRALDFYLQYHEGTPGAGPQHQLSTSPAPGEGAIGVGSLGGGEEQESTPSRKAGRKPRTSRVSSPPPDVLPFPVPDDPPRHVEADVAARDATRSRNVELRWRIEECWRDHLLCRDGFYREQNGSPPGVHPTLTDEIAKAIRDQLLAHDRDLLAPENRDRWRRESRVRAAGCGIFNDPWCSGRHPQNDALHGGGTRYLEPWRPWKRLHGKADPVPRFAQLYFEIRDAEEVAARVGRRA